MSQKRPLDTVAPEQDEARPSPTKRLRRIRRRERRRARAAAASLEQMMQMVRRVLLDLLNVLGEQFAALQREIPEGRPESGGSSGVVKLRFLDADRPNNPLYTRSPVQWQNEANAKIAIFRDGKQIMGGDLSKLQIEILPVHADFFTERGEQDFTKDEFNKQIYMYKGKESVLATVNLKKGEAYLGSFFFMESSYRKNLRLSARVKRLDLADRVHEAITEPFVVKDRRSESNEKSDVPSKRDLVHRLSKISQKGKRCIVLAEKKITTVKDLMRKYHEDKSGLQKLTGMKKENWSTMIKHATMCDPGDEIYSYRVAEENCELLFDDFYGPVGMITNGSYVHVRDHDQLQQLKVNSWKMSAYKEFEERENSGCLAPDYLMRNGHLVRQVPLNHEADAPNQGTSSINPESADIWNGLSQIEWQELLLQVNLADQSFVQDNDELPNSNIQFDGHEHDGTNR